MSATRLSTQYNPVAPNSLAESIGRALEGIEAARLDDLTPEVKGPGVYALYYVGPCAHYEPLSTLNREAMRAGLGPIAPIYVGKAMPEGQRSKKVELEDLDALLERPILHKRLSEHLGSIERVDNLLPEHFFARALVLAPVWVRLGESLLIQRYEPAWNHVVTGFGIHNPGRNRPQKRSDWDTLHRGRAETWSVPLKPGKPKKAIIEELEAHWLGWRDRVLETLSPERRRLLEERP